ncbi:MAG: sugar ABC transporter ATP-binding protein [Candidatus Hydrogenedentota bacterium]
MREGTTSEQPHLLAMSGMGKVFGRARVLEDVHFNLRSGEVHVLAGENGAGKSTLIKILAGVHSEHEGEIRLRGEAVRFRSPQHANKCGISVIHQELSLIPSMRVMDNIFLGRERCGPGGWMRYGTEEAACRALLARLGLDIDPGGLVEDYPISVQQTIEIAKALAFEARIIVMDEPTSALTMPEVARLFENIADLKARGCGIIYISHKMEEIYTVADRISVLRDGRYVGTADAGELPRSELIHWMVGRKVDERFPRHAANRGGVLLDVKDFTVPDPGGRPNPAVDGVSLAVHAGEVLGVGGLQGSGASALFAGLFGAYGRAVAGEVMLDGQPFTPVSPRQSIRAGLALLTNDRKRNGLVPGMDIVRNVTLASIPRYSRGWLLREGMEARAAARQKGVFGIRAASLRQEVGTLSGGNQQKVVLAKWLETRPKVLLLDEPTRGVDVGAKHEIYELINQWTAQGIAVLLITSEMPELLALSDRVIVMHRGRITAAFEQGEATQPDVLAAAMGGEGVPA